MFVGAELWPYASAGGLSRVMAYLPQEMLKQGIDVRVMIPKYGKIDSSKYKFKLVAHQFKVPSGEAEKDPVLICNVLSHQRPNGPITYFLENREYYELRANIYEYADDHIRWGLLQKGMWEFLKIYQDWTPDIIHCHEWQTGLIPNYFQQIYKKTDHLANIKFVLTLNNIMYQAPYDHRFVTELNYDGGKAPIPSLFSKDFAKLNSLRRGIIFSDLVTAVSPTYSREILTEDFGEGLDSLLRELRYKLIGILDGLDYKDYNPLTDLNIEQNYKKGEWQTRSQNKLFLQQKYGLDSGVEIPVFGLSYRLTEQKGLNLVMEVAETIIDEFGAEFVVNGDGDSKYKEFFLDLAKKYPTKVGINMTYDEKIPRQIFSGADFLLHPSKFEPCGIVQLEAMAYGCIPIVRKVGGLADTVIDEENGFVFQQYKSSSLLVTMARAVEVYKHKEIISRLRLACMNADFSWKVAAEKYIRNYKNLLGIK